MNRITQRHFPEESVKDLEALHDSLIRALGNRVPPSVASLYARPQVLAQGLVVWDSSFAGQPIALKDLSTQALAELKEKLFERLKAIQRLADQEASRFEHDPRLLQLLRHASADPPIEAIYSVGGQPVLLFWDKAISIASPREILIPPPPQVVVATATTRRRVWPWWLLALLLLLALIWWLWCPRSPLNAVDPLSALISSQPSLDNTPEPVAVPEPQVLATPPVELTPEPEHVPKPADPPFVDPEPVIEPEPEPEPIPVPEPVPEPPKVAPPVAPTPKPKPVVKAPATISTAKNLCPQDRPAALAPEMVVVFDASGSMMVNINATREEEIWMFSILNRGALAIQFLSPFDRRKVERLLSQPTRMVTAQQATINVLQRLPSDVSTGLVVVDECPTARNLGRYAPSQRSQMVSRLGGLSPRQGTPLADGIFEAGQLVDGVNKESTILLVSDGGESCGGDPCMVARDLARRKPHLKINVVDIGGTGAAACVAEATGGKVFTVSNISELKVGIDRAAQDALGPTHCKK
jgi:hypothetical protein